MMKKSKSSLLEKFNGIILVNKPSGLTSYDILRQFKKVFF
jgi:tRNA U55 pseudouridine synthase TruB